MAEELLPPTIEALLTKSQAAHVLGTSTRSVENWITRGLLRVVRPGGTLVRIDPTDLREFMERAKSTVASTEKP